MRGFLTAEIHGKWLYMPAGIATAILVLSAAVLWLIGLQNPTPRFILDPQAPGRIQAINWPWWREYADLMHGRKYMMLTFDDGPADQATNDAILNTLKKHHAHAAFFIVCRNAQNPAGVQTLKTLIAEGDPIANHSFNHHKIPKLADAELQHEVGDCQKFLEESTGQKIKWFRPPWGQPTPALETALKQYHMTDVLWETNSGDCWLHTPEEVNSATMLEANNGAVVLMHSNHVEALALDRSFTMLEEQGYRFVLADQ